MRLRLNEYQAEQKLCKINADKFGWLCDRWVIRSDREQLKFKIDFYCNWSYFRWLTFL